MEWLVVGFMVYLVGFGAMGYWMYGGPDDAGASVTAGLFWPIFLLIAIGAAIVEALGLKPDKGE